MARIFLLTGAAECGFLRKILKAHAGSNKIIASDRLSPVERRALPGDRLICFLTDYIIGENLLARLNYNCFNFHPGPPDYPGYRPASFAIYEKAREFGVTFHRMTRHVDQGEIIFTDRFPILENGNHIDLSCQSYSHSLQMFHHLAARLANPEYRFVANGQNWGKRRYRQRDYAEKRKIDRTISSEELTRRHAAFEGLYSQL